jgi:hypothetical protein
MDIGLKTLLGRSGGETFQMKFQGEGFVVKWDGMLIDSQGCLEWARGRRGEKSCCFPHSSTHQDLLMLIRENPS